MRYRVSAHNTATASANKIHDDEVARSLGFRGGLVPGVDVYAYLCHLPAELWGREWLERGTMRARFASPVYDGDEVTVQAEIGDGQQLSLTLSDPAGEVCATGVATLPAERAEASDPARWPSGPLPERPPPATAGVLGSTPLGAVRTTFSAERAGDYLDDIREHLDVFRVEQLAHPAWLLRQANHVLAANVALGPWIHVESSVAHLGVVRDGEEVETRALVVSISERRGHELVELDVLQLAVGRAVARTAHTAIFRPRGT